MLLRPKVRLGVQLWRKCFWIKQLLFILLSVLIISSGLLLTGYLISKEQEITPSFSDITPKFVVVLEISSLNLSSPIQEPCEL